MSYLIRPLSASTWDAFANLVERNNGIYGGCWCIAYHPECGQRDLVYRDVKEDGVKTVIRSRFRRDSGGWFSQAAVA